MWGGAFYNFPNHNPVQFALAKLGPNTSRVVNEPLYVAGKDGAYPNQNYHIANQLRAPSGDIFLGAFATYMYKYSYLGETITEYDQLPRLPGENFRDDSIYDQIFNADGSLLLFGTIATSGVHENRPQLCTRDPITGALVQYGRAGQTGRSLPGFAYYLHGDGPGVPQWWGLIGKEWWDLVRVDPVTGTITTMASTPPLTNSFATFTVYPEGLVANLYQQYGTASQTVVQYWCVDGQLYPFTPGYNPATLPFTPRNATAYTNPIIGAPSIDESVCPAAVNWRQISADPWTRVDFSLDYIQPIAIDSMQSSASGGVLGCAQQYDGWFSCAPPAAPISLGTGPDVSSATARATVGNLDYVAGYPNGALYVYDHTQPWNAVGNVNPKKLGSFSDGLTFSGVKTAKILSYSAVKNRLYMAGTRDREGSGAGIGDYDIVSKVFGGTFAGLDQALPMGLVALDAASCVVLSTQIYNGAVEPAQLVIYDQNLVELERQTIDDGWTDTGVLFSLSGSTVFGVRSSTDSTGHAIALLFQWNVATKTLVASGSASGQGSIEKIAASVRFKGAVETKIPAQWIETPAAGVTTEVGYVQTVETKKTVIHASSQSPIYGALGPRLAQRASDSSIWIVIGSQLVKVVPATLVATAIVSVASLLPLAAMAFAGDTLVLASGTQLYSFDTTGL